MIVYVINYRLIHNEIAAVRNNYNYLVADYLREVLSDIALCYSVKPSSYLIYDKDWKVFIKCSYKAQSAFLTA